MLKPFTAYDYLRGQPRINARVFADLWRFDAHSVDERGVFAAGDSAGTFSFATLVEAVRKTDVYNQLSESDAVEAVAMLFHLLPSMEPDVE